MSAESRVDGARVAAVVDAVLAAGDPDKVAGKARFFRTGPGQYAEGDQFVGVSVPTLRTMARGLTDLDRGDVDALLHSPIHEIRLLALIVMGAAVGKCADADQMRGWVRDYLRAVDDGRVNNWDLVDTSAAQVVGQWCVMTSDIGELTRSAAYESLWRRRVGIVGTHAMIRAGDATAILAVAPMVVDDRRDLIQKAFGWMLRETGKRVDSAVLVNYLDGHAAQMGATALSYATEHLDPETRTRYRHQRRAKQ